MSNPGKTVLLLSRKTKSLESFQAKLQECLGDKFKAQFDNKNVKISSVHAAKGLEYDIVIILQCSAGTFPLLHLNAVLDEVFGRTIKHVLDEEKRLFYVAITRAKEKLYFLYEGENYSQYLEELCRNSTACPFRKQRPPRTKYSMPDFCDFVYGKECKMSLSCSNPRV